jgi:hypothetical protein
MKLGLSVRERPRSPKIRLRRQCRR